MDANSFGARLKELRKKANLSQHQLADLSGVTRSAIAKFELGEREPMLTTAQQLAAGLGVDCTAFEVPPAAKPASKKRGKK
jgi:transcriptional regulator with XRE-family HTH domain